MAANTMWQRRHERRTEKRKIIMPKAIIIDNDNIKGEKMTQRKAPTYRSIERARKVMKLYQSKDYTRYNAELTKLLDEFGIDFVCQHACRAETDGRNACPEGRCERPLEYTGDKDCTCREMMFYYIDSFVGYRNEQDCKAAGASMYGKIPNKKRA
jgi:hypothetical protein